MSYQINSAVEARAALPEFLSNFAEHAQEMDTLKPQLANPKNDVTKK